MKLYKIVVGWIVFVAIMMFLMFGLVFLVGFKCYQSVNRPDGLKGAVEEVWHGSDEDNVDE